MNLFGASSIILFFASLGFGLFVYSKNRTSPLNRLWFLFSASVAVWGLALYGVTSTSNVQTAFYWQYLLDVMGIFIPVLYFFFVSNLLGLQNDAQRAVVGWLGILLIALSFTTWFKTGLQDNLGFFWIEPGKWYFLFPLFFAGLVLYSIYLLAHQYHQTSGVQLKQQIKYQLLGALIGFGGGMTNFLPQLFDIFPFGNYIITLYVLFIGYSVVSNRLFNLKTVAIELFAGGASLVFLINLLVSETPRDWFMRFVFFLLTLFFSFLMIRFVHRIEKLSEDKSKFVSFASHEIRNPLTFIKGASANILEGDFGGVSDELKDNLQKIFVRANEVLALVEQYLNKSRIELGQLKYEMTEFDVRSLISQIVKIYQSIAAQAGVALSFAVDEHQHYMLHGDQAKLKEVFNNLIDNAIKFSPKGKVAVSLSRDNEKISVKITDTGIGIPPEQIPLLFREFSRAGNASQSQISGTGLGLFLSKTFVEAHHGKIWAESEGADKGATFSVEVPVKQN